MVNDDGQHVGALRLGLRLCNLIPAEGAAERLGL